MNETINTILLQELRHIDFRNLYQIRTGNVHTQQWLTTQIYNINNRFSVEIEPIEFLWMEIENIVRNYFPDLVEQPKLPDKNPSSDISSMPAPGPVNHPNALQ